MRLMLQISALRKFCRVAAGGDSMSEIARSSGYIITPGLRCYILQKYFMWCLTSFHSE